jgi:hypothetical protein
LRSGFGEGRGSHWARSAAVDWLSYPILDITEAPEAVDIVLINRPELPPVGAALTTAMSRGALR